MKTKVIVGILVLLIVVNLATLGTYLYLRFAEPGEPGSGFRSGGPPPAMMELDIRLLETSKQRRFNWLRFLIDAVTAKTMLSDAAPTGPKSNTPAINGAAEVETDVSLA